MIRTINFIKNKKYVFTIFLVLKKSFCFKKRSILKHLSIIIKINDTLKYKRLVKKKKNFILNILKKRYILISKFILI